MNSEWLVFANEPNRWPGIAPALQVVGVSCLASMAITWWALRGDEANPSPKQMTRAWALSGLLIFWTVVLVWLVVASWRPFDRLRLEGSAVRLEFVRPWLHQELLPWTRVEAVVAGGGPDKRQWTHGCHLRFWLRGGGSRVSAHNVDTTRAQCEATRDQLEAARRAAADVSVVH